MLQRRIGKDRIEVVAKVAYIGANHSAVNIQVKRIGIVERGIYIAVSSRKISIQPSHINAKTRAFAKKQIMRMDPGL